MGRQQTRRPCLAPQSANQLIARAMRAATGIGLMRHHDITDEAFDPAS